MAGVRTDCKPRVNNLHIRGEKGVRGEGIRLTLPGSGGPRFQARERRVLRPSLIRFDPVWPFEVTEIIEITGPPGDLL